MQLSEKKGRGNGNHGGPLYAWFISGSSAFVCFSPTPNVPADEAGDGPVRQSGNASAASYSGALAAAEAQKLVLDWRKRQQTRAQGKVTIIDSRIIVVHTPGDASRYKR